ncbi:hypothetical protein [Parahaliea mediterranea]|uniref:Tetratricopeptide repeat protein n=1 Tax=Parahaliea mediterranea TaxID=651086 RepID=A0A939DC03_9GAMM|nr:hypothetical protein [Parahaliea mediterranea]MBN7795395.1 hypothetical protein [Parahaliea mediterranea]
MNKALVLGRPPYPLAFIAAVFLLLSAWIYTQGLDGPWLFDDRGNIVDNHQLAIEGGEVDAWRTASLSSGSGPLRRPLAMGSFAAQHAFSPDVSPAAFKAANVLLHFVIGGVVWLFCRAVLSGLPGRRHSKALVDRVAVVAALIWIAHPLNVSTVLYAVQRMAQLSTLFVVLGLWVFARSRNRWLRQIPSAGEVVAAALWLLVLTILATYSKENGALLPLLVVALEVSVYRGRLGGRSFPAVSGTALCLLLLPCLLLAAWLIFNPDAIRSMYGNREFTLGERLLTQPRVLWHYVHWIMTPTLSSYGLFHDDIPISFGLWSPATTAIAIVLWAGLLVLAVALGKRAPLLLCAVLFFLVGQAMESSFLPLEMVFEHRNYLPMIGVVLFVAYLLVELGERMPASLSWAPWTVALAILCAQLYIRAHTWSDPVRLAQVSALNHPHSPRSLNAYAGELVSLAQSESSAGESGAQRLEWMALARHYYEQAFAVDPRNLSALVMLYQIDSQHFSDLGEERRWRNVILALLEDRKISASDYTALKTLVACLGRGECAGGEPFAWQIITAVKHRYPGSPRIALLEYGFLVAADAPAVQRIAALEAALARSPGSRQLYSPLINEYGSLDSVGRVFEYTAALMAVDVERRQLSLIKQMFVPRQPEDEEERR